MLAQKLKSIADDKNTDIAKEAVDKAYNYIVERCQKLAKEGCYGGAFYESSAEEVLKPIFVYSNYQQRVKELLEEKLVSEGFKYLYMRGMDGDGDYFEVSFRS